MSALAGPLVLNDDVMLIPVTDLPDDSRAQLTCGDDDVAISRLEGRTGSKIVDVDTAALLGRFREPRRPIDAVILFSREKGLEAEAVFEAAFPMLRSMVESGVLVPAAGLQETSKPRTRWSAGDAALGGTIVRTLQVLEDTEVYLTAAPDGDLSVLKVARQKDEARHPVAFRLAREAAVLARLDGTVAPRLCDLGQIDGCSFLRLEFLRGTDPATAAAEWRHRSGESALAMLLDLAVAVARAYATLHERGVLHGDVHPRNMFVEAGGGIRVLDYGLARAFDPDEEQSRDVERGGIPFFYDPELARAYLAKQRPPAVTPTSEQFGVAALVYYLLTGQYWQDFRLEREGMLQDIVERPVLSFSSRGVEPWPAVEAILSRALAKDPNERFPSMKAFADALASVATAVTRAPVIAHAQPSALEQLLDRTRRNTALDGPWLGRPFTPTPVASLNYGSIGVAMGLLCMAHRLDDPRALATADAWLRRAALDVERDGAFHNAEIEITPELVGQASPYHSQSGFYAVWALAARANGDRQGQALATENFLRASRRRAAGFDLTLGTSSTLLGSAIVLDAAAGVGYDTTELRSFGDGVVDDLWRHLDGIGTMRDCGIDYLGIAHGWAGYLYATLTWSRVSGAAVPSGVARRLHELTTMAMPAGRGVEWPWVLKAHRHGNPPTMSGWCNGSCGYVFLYTLAHRLLGESRWLRTAIDAGWNSWESADVSGSLCCGLAGRAYALLNLYRHTGERIWLDRARDLAHRAAHEGNIPPEYPHSLYKGEFGLAVLAADLQQPDEAVMPFFEPMGYAD